MAQVADIDYLMHVGPDGVLTYTGGEAVANQIREWLDTPAGSVWGRPSWGHQLDQFRHQPPDRFLEMEIEMHVVEKMSRDLENVEISGVRVNALEFDRYKITVVANGETVSVEV